MEALLPKDRVELLRDIVLLVTDVSLAQPDGDVGVSFAIDVCRVQVCGLGWGRDAPEQASHVLTIQCPYPPCSMVVKGRSTGQESGELLCDLGNRLWAMTSPSIKDGN